MKSVPKPTSKEKHTCSCTPLQLISAYYRPFGLQTLGGGGFHAANLLLDLLTLTVHPEDTRHGSFYDIFPLPWVAESYRWQASSTLLSRVR